MAEVPVGDTPYLPISRPRRSVPGMGWPAAACSGQSLRVQVRELSAEPDRRRRQRIALGLAWATIAWNPVEAVVAIVSGVAASSIALVGFGLDSTVDVLSASVIVWQMTRDLPEDREEQALRLIAVSFFALGGYVTVQAVFDLASRSEPDTSTVGIALAAVSLVVMPPARQAEASQRTPSRLGQRGRRQQPNAAVHVSLGGSPRGPRAQRDGRLVVGRPGARARYRRTCHKWGPRGVARGNAALDMRTSLRPGQPPLSRRVGVSAVTGTPTYHPLLPMPPRVSIRPTVVMGDRPANRWWLRQCGSRVGAGGCCARAARQVLGPSLRPVRTSTRTGHYACMDRAAILASRRLRWSWVVPVATTMSP
jgi:hypothetical protein